MHEMCKIGMLNFCDLGPRYVRLSFETAEVEWRSLSFCTCWSKDTRSTAHPPDLPIQSELPESLMIPHRAPAPFPALLKAKSMVSSPPATTQMATKVTRRTKSSTMYLYLALIRTRTTTVSLTRKKRKTMAQTRRALIPTATG